MKVGDLVRNAYKVNGAFRVDGIGIVLDISYFERGKARRVKVATPQGITYWWPEFTEVVDESR